MFDTSRSRYRPAQDSRRAIVGVLGFAGLTICGILLRLPRLNWQPLWWDEGYSAYFATEPLNRMVALTALDIHPPLYYAALHHWIALLGAPSPVVLRGFSVLAGVIALPLFYWMASGLFGSPVSRSSSPLSSRTNSSLLWIAGLGTLFFALNPLHIYYSQEVRMYGLALTFSIWSTGSFWRLLHTANSTVKRTRWIILSYILSTALGLYTLYYSALIPIAHLLFTLWQFGIRRRRSFPMVIRVISAQIGIALLYLPWVFYVLPKLTTYVVSKVGADNDTPLTLPIYLGRHATAFFVGHLPSSWPYVETISELAGWVIIATLGYGVVWMLAYSRKLASTPQPEDQAESIHQPEPISALWFFLLIPVTLGFLINLVYPFFPEGGERLLLVVLPYFLLLLAAGIAHFPSSWQRVIGLIIVLAPTVFGTGAFYTVPRHADRDYRTLVQHVMQNGQSADQVLALFPWQVGYWRAYAPEAAEIGPTPTLLGSETLEWNDEIRQQVDASIAGQGSLWFPMPLGLGSTLPADIRTYLEGAERDQQSDSQANDKEVINFESIWTNSSTLLTGWRTVVKPEIESRSQQFESIMLAGSAIAPREVHSANELLTVRLLWQGIEPEKAGRYVVTLRLKDREGRLWSQHDYALKELASPNPLRSQNPDETRDPTSDVESISGLIVPAGLVPGDYVVELGLSETSATNVVNELRPEQRDESERNYEARPLRVNQSDAPDLPIGDPHFMTIGTIQVHAPESSLSPVRLPIDQPLHQPAHVDGLLFLGSSGADNDSSVLAGTEIPLRVHLQNQAYQGERAQLFVSLLDEDGNGVAGREEWPYPNYPLSAWSQNALVQLPVPVQVPAIIPTGNYRLITGLVNPVNGDKSEAVELGIVRVIQRDAEWTQPQIGHPLAGGSARFGSHVDLLGFDLIDNTAEGMGGAQTVEVRLYWHVQRSLLPPHHIFVHLIEDGGTNPLAQHDDAPTALTIRSQDEDWVEGPAPTGSWQPEEYLTTRHILTLPTDTNFDEANGIIMRDDKQLQIRVGLYLPKTGVRLPVSHPNQLGGDNVILFSE